MSFSIKIFFSLFLLVFNYLSVFFNFFPSNAVSSHWLNSFQSSQIISEQISASDAPARLSLGQKIKLNQAQLKDLEYLPGIGKKTAELILAERARRGHFQHLEDLMTIKGIKEKKFSKIKPYLEL